MILYLLSNGMIPINNEQLAMNIGTLEITRLRVGDAHHNYLFLCGRVTVAKRPVAIACIDLLLGRT
jgi:hypothetical protein